MDEEEEGLTLNQVAVLYSGRPDRPASVGGLNPYGFWIWPGAENSIACFSSKTVGFFGGIRIRALRVRGIRSAEFRGELIGVEEDVTLWRYILACIRLFVVGVPLGNIGDPPVRLLDPERTNLSGSFQLIRSETN